MRAAIFSKAYSARSEPYGLFPLRQHSEILNSHLANILIFTPEYFMFIKNNDTDYSELLV